MDLTQYRMTKRTLDAVVSELVDAFPDLDPSCVRDEVRSISGELLATARFVDFVPLLTFRHARDRLLGRRLELQQAA